MSKDLREEVRRILAPDSEGVSPRMTGGNACVIWGDPINPLFHTHTESIPQGYGIHSARIRNTFRNLAEYRRTATLEL